jgi:hypothetical protein
MPHEAIYPTHIPVGVSSDAATQARGIPEMRRRTRTADRYEPGPLHTGPDLLTRLWPHRATTP